MPLRNTKYTFGSATKFFHWIIGLLIIGMLAMGLIMTRLSDQVLRRELYNIHKSLGLTILGLIILRILWRAINRAPKYPDSIPLWEQKVAHLAHALLYILMIAMPLSGWIMSTASGHPISFWGLFQFGLPGIEANRNVTKLFNQIHEYIGYTLIVVIVIHVLSALKHHFLGKNKVLRRMLPFTNKD